MKTFRKLLLFWMIVWLPVAGTLAAVMPLTDTFGAISVRTASIIEDSNVVAMPCHGTTQDGKTTFGPSCSDCALCDLAGVLALPEIPFVVANIPTSVYIASQVFNHPSFVPELISPPPRAPALAK